MEEIKIGEYVRTRKGKITKVIGVEIENYDDGTTEIFCETELNPGYLDYTSKDIIKHSSNIKDLVQAGDIVVYTINCKFADIEIVKEHTDTRTLEKTLRVGLWSLEQVNIKQILTKEKFERESYRVEE